MQVTLCNRTHPEYGSATIPLPIPDEEYGRCIELLEAMEIGETTAHDCYVDQITDAPPVLNRLEKTMINIDELDFLTRSLDRYTENELARFQGMTYLRDYRDVPDLINLSFSCEQVTVITDFSDLERIGRRHYLTIHGGCVPREEMNALNGYGIARELIADGDGRITPYGVVFENAMTMETGYDGHCFPAYAGREFRMEFTLESEQYGDAVLFLPMPEKRLERLLERAAIHSREDVQIKDWNSGFSDTILSRMNVTRESLFELNRLCEALMKLDHSQMKMLEAVVNYAEPRGAAAIRRLSENLDSFNYAEGVQTADAYGRYLIQESGHYDYDENLDDYYDYEKCGRDQMESENGGFTSEGYVAYLGETSLEELMLESPPERSAGMQMGGLS